MTFDSLISPKEIEIAGRGFTISKIPAMQAQEIYSAVITESSPHGDIGVTMLSKNTIKRLLSYVFSRAENGTPVALDYEGAIDNFCKDLYVVHSLVIAMIKENFGFLFDGSLQSALESLSE